MLEKHYPLYVGNAPRRTESQLAVTDKFSGEIATHVSLADPKIIDEAIGLAVTAAKPMAKLYAYERQAILNHCVKQAINNREPLHRHA